MLDDAAIEALTAVHRRLIEALSDLERAGEFAAAAHLVAAIDILETRVEADHGVSVQPGTSNAVIEIAGRMRDAFGAKADAVARRQLVAATGSAILAWAAIVNRIGELDA